MQCGFPPTTPKFVKVERANLHADGEREREKKSEVLSNLWEGEVRRRRRQKISPAADPLDRLLLCLPLGDRCNIHLFSQTCGQ